MAMKAPAVAICGDTSCPNNASRAQVLVCTRCGRCGNDAFHDDCATSSTGMSKPIVAICGEESCTNAENGVQILLCSTEGRCSDCWQHEHGVLAGSEL